MEVWGFAWVEECVCVDVELHAWVKVWGVAWVEGCVWGVAWVEVEVWG